MRSSDNFKNMLGTIIRSQVHPGNPAETPEEEPLFFNAYEEIVIISTGANRAFPAGRWRIRLVTYRDRMQHPIRTGKTCSFIAVEPDNVILDVETFVGQAPGDSGQRGLIKLAMYSDYTKDRQEVLICGDLIVPDTPDQALVA